MVAAKKNELAALTKEELVAKIKEMKMDLIKENAQVATGTVSKNPGKIKLLKKTIARILTILNSKKYEKTAVAVKKK